VATQSLPQEMTAGEHAAEFGKALARLIDNLDEVTNVLDWRQQMGLTQTQAGQALGKSLREIQYYETGEQELPRSVLLAMRYLRLAHLAKQAARPSTETPMALELLAQIDQGDVMTKARRYKAILDETGWSAVEIPRQLYGPRGPHNKTEFNRCHNDVIDHLNFLLHLEPEYQALVISGQLTVGECYELARVPTAYRPRLRAAYEQGMSRWKVRKLARQLCPEARGPVPAY